MENTKANPITIGAQDGQSISVAGGTYRILVSGKETGGAFAAIDMLIPPNAGPGPHSHEHFHETFYVVEGEVEVKSEVGSYTAKKGAYVVIPKGGIIHKFQNKTNTTAQLLCVVIPSGLEEMFIAMGKPIASGTFLPSAPPPDEESMAKIKALAAQFGQVLYPPDFLG